MIHHPLLQLIPFSGRYLFAIPQGPIEVIRIQDHRRSGNRTSQRTSSGFINSCNRTETQLIQFPFLLKPVIGERVINKSRRKQRGNFL